MDVTKKAIESAYSAQVAAAYSVFAGAILEAGEDAAKIETAEHKFSRAVELANNVLTRANALV